MKVSYKIVRVSLSLGDIYLDIFLCFLSGIYIVDDELYCNQEFILSISVFFSIPETLSSSLFSLVFPLCSYSVLVAFHPIEEDEAMKVGSKGKKVSCEAMQACLSCIHLSYMAEN